MPAPNIAIFDNGDLCRHKASKRLGTVIQWWAARTITGRPQNPTSAKRKYLVEFPDGNREYFQARELESPNGV